MKNILWIAVTNDDYELPAFVEESLKALAISMGADIGNVSRAAAGKKDTCSGYKIRKVELDDE